MITTSPKVLTLIIIMLAPAFSWGVNPHDEYYADDIFTAIDEAKKRPHHYDYSRAKRYNRSTTQSLDIPRLLNQEMGTTSIDSRDENSITAKDTPVNKQLQKHHPLDENSIGSTQTLPITTVTPVIGNPNVQSPNIKTNISAH
jgi:hypothetical protein